MALPPLSLKGRALRLLSAREYSRTELERKLCAHEQAPGQLAMALDELQAKGFLNEQRVVESVVYRRAAGLGAARIRHELQQKGLAAGVVQDAVARLQASELQRARNVWQKKFGAATATGESAPALNTTERARQMRFLASRGFGADAIRRVVGGWSGDDAMRAD